MSTRAAALLTIALGAGPAAASATWTVTPAAHSAGTAVSGCAGLVRDGDAAAYTAGYVVSPAQVITSP